MYSPPFVVSEKAVSLIADIAESVGTLSSSDLVKTGPMLRKISKLQSVSSSLAIESNSLSFDQVTDVIEGKHVLGTVKEIAEVKAAYECYSMISEFDPFSKEDLLRAHGVMMKDVMGDPGKFRNGNVGVFSGDQAVHIAPPADNVPFLIDDLLYWIKNSNTHILIKSCVFHYEFEFIHPFFDGNGRMGRFWQTLLLMKWNPFLEFIPIETLIYQHQQEYYRAIRDSTSAGQSGPFLEFMLTQIHDSIMSVQDHGLMIDLSDIELAVYQAIKNGTFTTNASFADGASVSERTVARAISKLKEQGIIVRQGSNKSGSWVIRTS